MSHKLATIAKKLDIKELRLRRHSKVKRSNRKAVANLKEAIYSLTSNEQKELKELLNGKQ